MYVDCDNPTFDKKVRAFEEYLKTVTPAPNLATSFDEAVALAVRVAIERRSRGIKPLADKFGV